jgi:hypothetical protein
MVQYAEIVLRVGEHPEVCCVCVCVRVCGRWGGGGGGQSASINQSIQKWKPRSSVFRLTTVKQEKEARQRREREEDIASPSGRESGGQSKKTAVETAGFVYTKNNCTEWNVTQLATHRTPTTARLDTRSRVTPQYRAAPALPAVLVARRLASRGPPSTSPSTLRGRQLRQTNGYI